MTTIKKTRKAPNPDGAWIEKFIKALAENGNVSAACIRANVSKNTVYEWRKKDIDFAARWESALEDAIESLESVAWERAKTTSDTLVIFLLKSLKPAVYRENTRLELSGNVDITNHYESASQVFDSIISETTKRPTEADVPSETNPRTKG